MAPRAPRRAEPQQPDPGGHFRSAAERASTQSWLHQIEAVFSIIQPKVVRAGEFAGLGALAKRLMAFEQRSDSTAWPFGWRFTTKDLAALLERLDAHASATPLAV